VSLASFFCSSSFVIAPPHRHVGLHPHKHASDRWIARLPRRGGRRGGRQLPSARFGSTDFTVTLGTEAGLYPPQARFGIEGAHGWPVARREPASHAWRGALASSCVRLLLTILVATNRGPVLQFALALRKARS
jgi:hypothetical protein